MATGKKSFVLYTDLYHTIKKLPKLKAGELFLTILAYVNDENPVIKDLLVEVTFEPIRQQLKRDLEKWNTFQAKQVENGKKGGRPAKDMPLENNPENPSLLPETQDNPEEPKKAVTVNVNDNVTKEIINYLNVAIGSKFRDSSKTTQKHIHARLSENYSLDDFKKVIDKKKSDWIKDPKMKEFLRPDTLFGVKFESYLMSATVQPRQVTRDNSELVNPWHG